jgi:hypothetical protein
MTDPRLEDVVREIERHAAAEGWDRPARLYALVNTAELFAHEPALAGVLGAAEAGLTPVEQETLPVDRSLEDVLEQVVFPAQVHGVAAVVERLVLPPSAGELPDDAAAARAVAESHPDRQDVRIVAAVTRSGSAYCALRMRAHDDDDSVVESPDLVPALLQLLQTTLDEGPEQEW